MPLFTRFFKPASLFEYIKAYAPAVWWALLIFYLSSQSVLPGPEVVLFDFLFKKSAHIFVYAVLYFLTYRALQKTLKPHHTTLLLVLPFLFCLGYAVSDELHQSLTPNRLPSLRDVGFDSLGMLLVFLKKYHYI